MIFQVIKILILKIIAMKKPFFSQIILFTFLFAGLFANAQIRVKTNNQTGKKNIVVKKNRSNSYNKGSVTVKKNKTKHPNIYDRGGVIVKSNRNRVVVNKPRKPRIIVKRPNYNRKGYIWVDGYWKWNTFYGQYTWQKARWVKVKRNHYWIPGFWEITPGGFFWVNGYWQLEF